MNKPISKRTPSVVTHVKFPRVVTVPPAEWTANTPYGMQRFNASPEGRLVRLADSVKWLMDTQDLPGAVAVERICADLQSDGAAESLYVLNEADYAQKLGEDYCFFPAPILSCEPVREPAKENCGLQGALKCIRLHWGETGTPGIGYMENVLDPLSIRIEKAFELWGYGRRVVRKRFSRAAPP